MTRELPRLPALGGRLLGRPGPGAGTGLASVAFGIVQALAASQRIARAEAAGGHCFLVARRPGLGTPQLTTRASSEEQPPTTVAASAVR